MLALSAFVACTQAGYLGGGHGIGYAAAPVAVAAPAHHAVDYYVSNNRSSFEIL